MSRITFDPGIVESSEADETFDKMVDRAMRMFAGEAGQVSKAVTIALRWLEQDESVRRSVVTRLLTQHIEVKIRDLQKGQK